MIQSVFTLLYIGESCGANTWNIYYYTILELLFNINSNINSNKFLIQTVKMASAWGKVPQVQPVDLSDIMSEEVAKDLQKKEFAYFENATAQALVAINPGENLIPEIKDDKLDEIAVKELLYDEAEVQDDLEIAMMLQQQYDKEYDDMLKRTEDKYNGSSKVSVSFTNYRRATLNPGKRNSILYYTRSHMNLKYFQILKVILTKRKSQKTPKRTGIDLMAFSVI